MIVGGQLSIVCPHTHLLVSIVQSLVLFLQLVVLLLHFLQIELQVHHLEEQFLLAHLLLWKCSILLLLFEKGLFVSPQFFYFLLFTHQEEVSAFEFPLCSPQLVEELGFVPSQHDALLVQGDVERSLETQVLSAWFHFLDRWLVDLGDLYHWVLQTDRAFHPVFRASHRSVNQTAIHAVDFPYGLLYPWSEGVVESYAWFLRHLHHVGVGIVWEVFALSIFSTNSYIHI